MDEYYVAVVRRLEDGTVNKYFDGPFYDADQADRIAQQERDAPRGRARVEVMGVR